MIAGTKLFLSGIYILYDQGVIDPVYPLEGIPILFGSGHFVIGGRPISSC